MAIPVSEQDIQERLRALEADGKATAALTERVIHLGDKVQTGFARTEKLVEQLVERVDGVAAAVARVAVHAQDQADKVARLQEVEVKRRRRNSKAIKWAAGIAAGLLLAFGKMALAFFMGAK